MKIENDLSDLKVGEKRKWNNCVYSGEFEVLYMNEEVVFVKGIGYNNFDLEFVIKNSIQTPKKISVKYYVHDYLDEQGFPCRFTGINQNTKPILSEREKYLGYTEINKTYEVKE